MKKIIIVYGLISGTIVAAMLLITMPMYQNGMLNMDYGEYLGYTTMIVALSLIFFGVKSFRDNYQNGVITFWKGVQVGILIALVASVMYALSWEISYSQIGEDFQKGMSDRYYEKIRKESKTETERIMATKRVEDFIESYKNPAFRFGISLVEIFPVGIIITLISAALLRKKEFLTNEPKTVIS